MELLTKFRKLLILSFFLLGGILSAQDFPGCSELRESLLEDAQNGIYHFYFSSGGMLPRTIDQAKKETAFLKKYPKIRIVNGGCAFHPCDREYGAPNYVTLRNNALDKSYGPQWRDEFPEHIGKFILLTNDRAE